MVETTLFTSGLPAGASGWASIPSLGEKLELLLERARRAWPELTVDPRHLLPYLAQRVSVVDNPAEALAALPVEDLALACACTSGDTKAQAVLEERYFPRVVPVISRLTPARVDEALQGLRERLFLARRAGQPRIADFTGRGPLLSWLRAAAVRIALNLRRDEDEPARRAEADELDQLPLGLPDPELSLLQAQHRQAFKEVFRQALAESTVRERTVLRLQTVDGLSLERIGAVYGVNKSTVFRWMEAAVERLSERIRELLRARLLLDSQELESVLRAMRSQLTLSASAFEVPE